MTKRKNPDIDLRTGLPTRSKRSKRRTPEEIERARKNGEPIRDQSGGNRSRMIKTKDGFKTREALGLDKRFSSNERKLTQVTDQLDKADDWRMTLRDRLEETKRSMFVEAKRNNNTISPTDERKVRGLEADLSRINQKVDTLRKEKSDLKFKLNK